MAVNPTATVTVVPVPPTTTTFQFNVTMSDSNVYEFFFTAVDQPTATQDLIAELQAIIAAL